MPCRKRMRGFTLVEAVMVIAVMGIIAVSTSVFIGGPVQTWVITARRAQLADTADTALRLLARDVQGALPNSLRVSSVGSVVFMEYLPVLSAGHYRSAPDPLGTGTTLDFSSLSGSSFEIIGPYDVPAVGSQLVVFNLGSAVTQSDAYAGGNRRTISAINTTSNILSYALGSGQFPYASPSDRFYVIATASSYVCDPVAGTLTRYSGYAIQSSQPASTSVLPLSSATKGVVAKGVTACAVSLNQTFQSRGLVSVNLTLSAGSDALTFHQDLNVPNVP